MYTETLLFVLNSMIVSQCKEYEKSMGPLFSMRNQIRLYIASILNSIPNKCLQTILSIWAS